jgi:hypothetical protein
MKITAEEFLEAKFGRMQEAGYTIIPKNERDEQRTGYLQDLLYEFKAILFAEHLAQAKNPKSGTFTLIDKDKGDIIGAFENPVI